MRPLPSLLSPVGGAAAGAAAHAEDHVSPAAPLTDDEFLARWEGRSLPSWGHESRLRLIWLRLQRLERRAALQTLWAELKAFEGEGHHVTKAYFWVAVVTACAAKAPGGAAAPASFADFYRLPTSAPVRNPDLVYKHYSAKLLDFDPGRAFGSSGPEAKAAPRLEFVPPDLKPLPSVVAGEAEKPPATWLSWLGLG